MSGAADWFAGVLQGNTLKAANDIAYTTLLLGPSRSCCPRSLAGVGRGTEVDLGYIGSRDGSHSITDSKTNLAGIAAQIRSGP